MRRLINFSDISRPTVCKDSECKGIMVFCGLGQYKCEKCGAIEYDDYGKVRNYIDEHPGANVAQISDITGVSRRSINNMVKDGRFEVTADSKTFMVCEICGTSIRSGRACQKCEAIYHKKYEEEARKVSIQGGYGKGEVDDTHGAKRFHRDI